MPIAVKPAITLTVVIVILAPTLKASRTDAGASAQHRQERLLGPEPPGVIGSSVAVDCRTPGREQRCGRTGGCRRRPAGTRWSGAGGPSRPPATRRPSGGTASAGGGRRKRLLDALQKLTTCPCTQTPRMTRPTTTAASVSWNASGRSRRKAKSKLSRREDVEPGQGPDRERPGEKERRSRDVERRKHERARDDGRVRAAGHGAVPRR